MTDFITGAITSIVSLLLGLAGHIVWENYQEKKKAHNESLRNHFSDLRKEVIIGLSQIMGGVTNSEGRLWIHTESERGGVYSSPRHTWLTKDFKEGNFHIFKLHFPSQADTTTKLMNEVDKHNENLQSFIYKLKGLIEENTGTPVREGKKPPFIYSKVPTYLQETLCQIGEGKSLSHDFRQAKIEPSGQILPSGDYTEIREITEAELEATLEGSEEPTVHHDSAWKLSSPTVTYALLTTQQGANRCKESLVDLMESNSLLKEMSDIYLEAKRLESEARNLASLLDFICDQHDKYGKLLKREKDCPVCQIIFQ